MWRLAGWAALGVAAVLFAAAMVALYGADRFERPGPLMGDTIVYIAPGGGVEVIAARLTESGVIDDDLIFRLGVRALGETRRLKAGEYLFKAGVSMRGAVQILTSGKTVKHKLTLPEGLTSAEAFALVEAAEFLAGETGPVPAEGSLLPETYLSERGDVRAALIARMRRARDEALAEYWGKRAEGLPFNTPEDALILASIVEKETGVPEERPLVASVFVNRLRKGMRLQSDPTVVYGLTGGTSPLGRPLTRQDLKTPGPYNTYLNAGLTPGPIANPGRAAIEAVLNPAKTKFLYFVADGSGGHAFATTLKEHNRNVAKWRKVKKQQN
jgi:UPF0755 protein